MPDPIGVYNALDPAQLSSALDAIEADLAQPEATETEVTPETVADIPEFTELIGIDPAVYRQIRGALRSGKKHLMFYGPPGTGKTTLAQLVAGALHVSPKIITGSADWTSQDIIGGYQPIAGGIRFVKGVLLEHFDKPLVIDELNRCDIDKVIGPLFTVLAGQPTTLPYQVDPGDATSPRYVILPNPKPDAEVYELAPTASWRILSTINSIDKASLYQMSYALTRRFGWILIDVPSDLDAFIRMYCTARGVGVAPPAQPPVPPIPVARIWRAVNQVRRMGPAPFIDIMNMCVALSPGFNFFQTVTEPDRATYVDALSTFLFPMLDGILREEAARLAAELATALELPGDHALRELIITRLRDLSVS
jgi:5-methylcytosine-specific restriction protein B